MISSGNLSLSTSGYHNNYHGLVKAKINNYTINPNNILTSIFYLQRILLTRFGGDCSSKIHKLLEGKEVVCSLCDRRNLEALQDYHNVNYTLQDWESMGSAWPSLRSFKLEHYAYPAVLLKPD